MFVNLDCIYSKKVRGRKTCSGWQILVKDLPINKTSCLVCVPRDVFDVSMDVCRFFCVMDVRQIMA